MKRLRAIMLALLLVLLLLAGCTPKESKTNDTSTLPGINSPSEPTGPADTSDYHLSPVGTTAPETEDPGTAQSGNETPATDPVPETEPEGGIEVEEEYTVEIGDNVGVGGN